MKEVPMDAIPDYESREVFSNNALLKEHQQ